MYHNKYLKYKTKYLNIKSQQTGGMNPCENKSGYWIGPYGVLVPNHIRLVNATDGFNTRFKDGGETEMGCQSCSKMTAELYREKYAELRPD